MSCSPEVVSWMNECYDEVEALKERERERERHRETHETGAHEVETQEEEAQEEEAQEVEAFSQGYISFKDDINGRSEKTTFRGHHLANARFNNPVSQHGYEISAPAGEVGRKTKDFPAMTWSSAIISDYDPKGEPNIMFELSRGERGYSYHTMRMSQFEKLISKNKITIKKIM